jgi:CHASE2 domain-containing sensor protein
MPQQPVRAWSAVVQRVGLRLHWVYEAIFPPRHGHGFVKTWLHHLPVIVGLTLVVAFLAHLGWFSGYQSMALDSLLLAQRPQRSENVVIVTIGDDEYRSDRLFGGTSPLAPETLGLLLEAIAAGQPRVIAVDIDTSSEDLAPAYRKLWDKTQAEGWPPVIWSCDAVAEESHQGGHGLPALSVIPALGGLELPETSRGLIIMPSDADGVIRRWRRKFHITGDEHTADSFSWAVVKEYCRRAPAEALPRRLQPLREEGAASQGPDELLLNFAGDRYSFFHISAQTVLDSYRQREFWSSEQSPIRGKIVLLGGTYRAARDVHPTPMGRVAGIELVAMAVESELQGRGVRFLHEAFAIAIDILFGSLLVYLNWRFASPRAALLNLLAVGALALLASYLTFNTLGYWLNFALVLTGIWLHHQLDVLREVPRLHHEIDELKQRLRQQNAAGAPSPQYESPPLPAEIAPVP